MFGAGKLPISLHNRPEKITAFAAQLMEEQILALLGQEDYAPANVPEPGSLLLVAVAGLAAIGMGRRYRQGS